MGQIVRRAASRVVRPFNDQFPVGYFGEKDEPARAPCQEACAYRQASKFKAGRMKKRVTLRGRSSSPLVQVLVSDAPHGEPLFRKLYCHIPAVRTHLVRENFDP